MKNTIPKPSQWLHITEFIRSFFETIRGFFYLLTTAREDLGKGRPVMVVPGLLTSDISTYILRKYLTKKGYIVYGWQLGINLGGMEKLPELVGKIEFINARHQQPIILIGWSMGGLFSRVVCHQHPTLIAKVVTIGSPFADVHAPNNARWVFELLNDQHSVDNDISTRLAAITQMPSVAIYSKSDGIVPWQACMDLHTDQQHINKEVISSHFGMGANPNVLQAILQSLV